MPRHLLAVAVVFVMACASQQVVTRPEVSPQDPTLAALSAGAIGCPPDEIRIADYRDVTRTVEGTPAEETSTWAASCRGKQFYCTGAHTTQCHEALPAVAPGAQAAR